MLIDRQALHARIVEAARRWYRYGNEAELAAAVQELEQLLRQPSADEQTSTSEAKP